MKRFAVAAGVLACTGIACASVLGFEELHVGADASVDAGSDVDASPDAAPDAGPACMHARWPERGDAAAGGSPVFAAVVRNIDFGLGDDAGANLTPPGFDLDRVCTVDPTTSSCAATQKPSDFATYVADKGGLMGGVDNAGYGLMKFLGTAGDAFKQKNLNAQIAGGKFGILVRVKGWNGLPDDADVFVEWFPLIGVNGPDGGATTPRFDMTDVWVRDGAYWNMLTYDSSNLIDQAAYVVGGKLVAHIDALALSFPLDFGVPARLDIVLHEGVVVADIVPDGASFRLANGTFTGRWASKDMLAGLQRVYEPTFSTFVCQSQMVYGNVKNVACPARDLMSAERDDRTDAGCNAVSIGVRFDTASALDKKSFATRADAGDPCTGAPVPANDDCN